MGQKLKIAGWVSIGVVAGALTTVSLQTVARGAMTPLPLEEIQQLSAVFGLIKTDYVEPVDDKKLITDAISGMVSSLDPHSQYFDKKSFKGTSTRISITGVRIKTDYCAGQSFIRSYATLTSSTDNTDDVITYLGVTKSV